MHSDKRWLQRGIQAEEMETYSTVMGIQGLQHSGCCYIQNLDGSILGTHDGMLVTRRKHCREPLHTTGRNNSARAG